MKRSIILFVICSWLAGGTFLLLDITKEVLGKIILENEFKYANGSHDQKFKRLWREGMIKCLDRKKNTIALECVLAYVYPNVKKDNPNPR